MKIKYIWYEEPEKPRMFDTQRGYAEQRARSRFYPETSFNGTQSEWDDFQISHLERDKKRGLVLSYDVLSE